MTSPSDLTVPTPLEVWRNAEPSFRGAVIAAMQETRQNRMRSFQAIMDRGREDPDVIALLERQEKLTDAETAAIEILREAAK